MNLLKSLSFIFALSLSYNVNAQCPATIASLGQGNGLQICWPNNGAPSTLTEITYDGITYTGLFVNAGQGDCWRTNQAATLGTNGNHTLEITIEGTTSTCEVVDGQFQEIIFGISLAYFGANEIEEAVLIEWQTLEEDNNAYFELEHSLDGFEYESIDRIEGAGTTNEMQFYEFRDEQSVYQIGTHYYRLKQVDFDGTTTYSEVIVLNIEEAQSFQVNKIFPNPAQDQLHIVLKLENSQNTQLAVVNATGQVVLQKNLNQRLDDIQNISLDISRLEAGCYFLRIQSGSTATTKKFIKI